MAEVDTIARPYADAVFALAATDEAAAAWSNALAALAAIVDNPDAAALIHDPTFDRARTADLIIDIGGEDFDAHAKNLVRLLAERSRLALAPAIAAQYEAMRARAANTQDVDVIAAAALTEAQEHALTEALEKRLHCSVRLSVTTDENMLGGAVIKAGDWVLDGSVTAQLQRLHWNMAH